MMTAVVTGASRGIGAAIVRALTEDDRVGRIVAIARSTPHAESRKVLAIAADCTDDDAVAAVAARSNEPVDLLVHCVGALDVGPRTPEKRIADLRAELLLDAFRTNVVAAALVLKAFAPRLQAAGGVAAFLSARVGSIGDNRLGGWYGYRASKAALNQFVRTAAIELARGSQTARVVAVHPGTTCTGLSARFVAHRDGVATAEETARRVLAVVRSVTPAQSGTFLNWDGTTLPW
jgi:NAD(P)-dependent dehydrogenase (short-subunit alcohol dehydrogenase family)